VAEIIDVPLDVALELGRLGKWIQAVGLIVVIWVIIQGITLYFNRRRRKLLEKISADLERLEKKVDGLAKKIN